MPRNLLCFVIMSSTIYIGCSGPARIHAPKIDASDAGSAALKQYDTNRDGKIADEELIPCPALFSALKRVDTDGDQAISAEEITARIKKWQTTNLGLTSARCTVTFRGQPLPNAKVVMEPESFLGNTIKSGEGTTGQTGSTVVKQTDSKLPGMPLGFYKIKITSDSVQIPATYNDNTILGVEIAPDNMNIENGIELNLK